MDVVNGDGIITEKVAMAFDYRLVASALLNVKVIDHVVKLADKQLRVHTCILSPYRADSHFSRMKAADKKSLMAHHIQWMTFAPLQSGSLLCKKGSTM